jgi:hypothetical protein
VTHDSTIQGRDQGKQNGSVGPQGIDDVAFQVLPEGAAVKVPNRPGILRTLVANFEQGLNLPESVGYYPGIIQKAEAVAGV